MNPVVDRLVATLKTLPEITKVDVDAPAVEFPTAPYFIDIATSTQGFVIEYRPKTSEFGLSSLPSESFSPDEAFEDEAKVLARVRELIRGVDHRKEVQ